MPGRSLEGKVAIVTGGGRGIGEAYALALAGEGARIVVNDIGIMDNGQPTADHVADRIRASGGKAIPSRDDITNFDAVARMVQATVENFGSLDILVANAGTIRPNKLYETSEADWTTVMGVHLTGTFNCLRHTAPIMIAQQGGSIITTGYGAGEGDPGRVGTGRDSFPGLGVYRAAKAAIVALTFNCASELQPYNINVNSVMPGATSTPMQQIFYDSLKKGGVGEEEFGSTWPDALPPDTVPPFGVFLCTAAARHITGRSFSVSGRRISVASAPSQRSTLEAESDYWSLAELETRAPSWLHSRRDRCG